MGYAQEVYVLEALKNVALDALGSFLKPWELFCKLAKRGNSGGDNKFILEDLQKVLTSNEQSTMGSESEDDFGKLSEDLDLACFKHFTNLTL